MKPQPPTSQLVIESILRKGEPAIFDVTITAHSDYDQAMINPEFSLPEEYSFKGIIDTGSQLTIITPGLFRDRHFGRVPLSAGITDADGDSRMCRGQRMILSFSSGTRIKRIEVPIFEKPFSGRLLAGYMLIGRSVLDHGILIYDGPGEKATITFADDRLVTSY